MHVVIRAMQKPKSTQRRLTCRMVMCVAAPQTKSARNTAVIGSSRVFAGVSPSPAFVGG